MPTAHASNGKSFEIPEPLWAKNQERQAMLLRFLALPLRENAQTLWLGVDSLSNLSACEAFSFLTGKIVEPVLLPSHELKSLLQTLAPSSFHIEEQPEFYQVKSATEPQTATASDEPVIQLLDHIFEQALQKNASDIHLEPQPQHLQIRFRIDGVLQHQTPVALTFSNRVISRLKLLAKLDIAETRLPQDGRFQFKTTFADILDFRLSTLPTNLGEKVVLRVQRNKPVDFGFAGLGMNQAQQQRLRQVLAQPQGLILVTGPTGSGKSITLYTALSYLNTADKHIMTAEDPIEIELEGIIQTQINPAIGLDFSRLLRTFLRQDPDIIMLGEIRDEESAAMALRAAQTGHLVLSTLHTNDAQSAISRLLQLGIKSHEIDNALLLVIAQRLVRKGCQKCRRIFPRLPDHQLHNEGSQLQSCDCHQGYKGRTGIYQFLRPDANAAGRYTTDFDSLYQAGLVKVKDGITDLKEIRRVIGDEDKTTL